MPDAPKPAPADAKPATAPVVPAAASDPKPAAPAAAAPAAPAEPAKSALPAKIRMIWPHGFIDENKRVRSWKAGEVISDPTEITLLVERKAQFEVVA